MQAEKQANRPCSATAVWQVASYVAVATLAAIITSAYYMASPGTQIADAYVRLNPGAVLVHSNTTVRLVGRVPPEQEQQMIDSIAGSGSAKAAAADGDATAVAEPDEEDGSTQGATSPAAAAAAADEEEEEEEKEDDPGYASLEKHPICNFLASGRQNPVSELSWGDITDFCNVTTAALQLGRVGANCYRCTDGANMCSQPPRVLYHQYLRTLHPHLWRGNLLSMQAYLMTQDLRHSELWVWTDQISNLYNNQTAPFFDAFKANIKIKVFDHGRLVVGTPWEDDPFLKNGTLVTQYMPNMGAYSDLVRLMLLWHHGGFWMDNDVLLLRDLHPLLAVSYQFIMRWTNAHCMLMFKGSLLLRKLMELARQLPLNHPKFKEDVIEKICKPVGYFAVAPGEYANTDVYNSCLFRVLRRNHNTFAPPDLMYELPLSWFDQEWPGCQGGRENVTDARWRELASNHLAMHTRYPKDGVYEGNGATPRTNRLIERFFLQCGHAGCVPQEGRDLLAYDGMR